MSPTLLQPQDANSGEEGLAGALDQLAEGAAALPGGAQTPAEDFEQTFGGTVRNWVNEFKDIELVKLGDSEIEDQVVENWVTIWDVTLITAVILTAFLLSRFVQRGMARAFERRQLRDKGTLIVAQRLTHYVIMTIGVFVGFATGDIDLTALITAGALFAVVVGFAIQGITENFVSGVILMLERSIKPGDILEIEGSVVRVVDMGIRATVVRSRDEEEEMIVPNSILVRTTVKNFTLADHDYRLRVRVGVSYASDLDLVREVLEQTAAELPFRIMTREPRILLWGFGSSSVDYDISVWVKDPWSAQRSRSTFQEHIWKAFKRAGIVIAFPQLDIHLDPPVARGLSSAASARSDA